MFESTPDPAWCYAPVWESMKEVQEQSKKIEELLTSEKAENPNQDIEQHLHSLLFNIRDIVNNWIYDVPHEINAPPEEK